ncbi:hypothetical protein [Vibrio sp. Hal054]|uniref:hypothetical protein n=1 Tax=Vibrio sp. Hal054 TaxID=3035158 RepID=UPI00301B9A15
MQRIFLAKLTFEKIVFSFVVGLTITLLSFQAQANQVAAQLPLLLVMHLLRKSLLTRLKQTLSRQTNTSLLPVR